MMAVRKRRWLFLLPCAVLFTLPTLASAQTVPDFDWRRDWSIGNSNIGASAHAELVITAVPGNSDIKGELEADIQLLGKNIDVLDASVHSWNSYGSGQAEVSIEILNKSVFKRTLNGTHEFVNWHRRQDLAKVSKTFVIGPVPVTVKAYAFGEVGVVVKASFSGFGAGAEANFSVSAGGGASASVGVPVLSFGIQCELSILNHKLDFGVDANIKFISGYGTYTFQALKWNLNLELKVLFFKKRFKIAEGATTPQVVRLFDFAVPLRMATDLPDVVPTSSGRELLSLGTPLPSIGSDFTRPALLKRPLPITPPWDPLPPPPPPTPVEYGDDGTYAPPVEEVSQDEVVDLNGGNGIEVEDLPDDPSYETCAICGCQGHAFCPHPSCPDNPNYRY